MEDWGNLKYAFQCQPTVQNGKSVDGLPATAALTGRIRMTPGVVQLTSDGLVSATLFGSAELPVRQVDLSTLRLSGAVATSVEYVDQDGDGFLDLRGQYRTSRMSLTAGSTRAALTGKLAGGQPFGGEAVIEVAQRSSGLYSPR